MNKIFDYIYYRTYLAYVKGNDPATLCSICYLSACIWILALPIAGFFFDMMRDKNGNINIIYWILYTIIVISCISIRYLRKGKIKEIKDYFSNCSANSIFPTWSFFFILPICIVIGFTVTICITSPIIRYYQLKGIGYNFFIEFFNN